MIRSLLFLGLLGLALACQPQLATTPPPTPFQMPEVYFDGRFYLPEDLESTLWAEAPMFYNPTNLDVDARGRVWVTEAINYRDFNNPKSPLDGPPGDRVMILEDTDQDGRADTARVFVEDPDLVAPLGIAVIGNQVIVSCSPNLLIYTDLDGDDRPDKKEKLLTGFGGLDHDHALHSVVAGPDGRWYFNTGNAGPHVVTDKSGWTLRSGSTYTGGTPYNQENAGNQKSDDGRVWVGGLALRVNPDGTGLKVLGHNFRNSYEVVPDSHGDLWQNDNDDQVLTCRTSWVMEGGNMGYFSADGTRYWQADHRAEQDTFAAHWHQHDPGVVPAGDRTYAGSPTGVLVYEGDELGPRYRGMLLSAEAGRNVIFAYRPQWKGAGFAFKRHNLISTVADDDYNYKWNQLKQDTRQWFRPSDVAAGTDGALYITDWYDPVVGGHQRKDSLSYGRIYRVAPKGKKLARPQIDLATPAGQVAALLSPAPNVRVLGFQKLKVQGEKVIPEVEKLLNAPNPYHRSRAIWLLATLGQAGLARTEQLLANPDPQVRLTAFRALRSVKPDVLPYARQLASDPAPAVRREVALALRDVPYAQMKDLALTLAQGYDGQDRYYLEALGLALSGKEAAAYTDFAAAMQPPADATRWPARFAGLAWRLHPPAAVPGLAARAQSFELGRAERLKALTALAFVNDKAAAQAMVNVANTWVRDAADQAHYWLKFRKSNDWYSLLDWNDPNSTLPTQVPPEILAAQRQVADSELSLADKTAAAKRLAADRLGAQWLIGQAANGKLEQGLYPIIAPEILANADQGVRVGASAYFTLPGSASVSIAKAAQLAGQVGPGKQVYTQKCATCHRIGDQGKDVGPQLTQIGKKFDKSGLMDAIVNPNAAITFGYEPWLVRTHSNQTVYGFLVSQGKTLVIKDLAGKETVIDAKDVAEKAQQNRSPMPNATGLGLNEQQLADLSAYLLTLR
ncbi:MAG: HEAT repeat domain-containing protein [Bernardetiaceae bacterium]|jgi:putative membrane-bound dehydrogenase-like protein|nr:HEAT repeat domain-containing protein [Bernardetiaceae bacterium]